MASFKLECNAHGDSPDSWASNALRFATVEECAAYGEELYSRWMGLKDKRVAGSEDPVNYTVDEYGRAVSLESTRGLGSA